MRNGAEKGTKRGESSSSGRAAAAVTDSRPHLSRALEGSVNERSRLRAKNLGDRTEPTRKSSRRMRRSFQTNTSTEERVPVRTELLPRNPRRAKLTGRRRRRAFHGPGVITAARADPSGAPIRRRPFFVRPRCEVRSERVDGTTVPRHGLATSNTASTVRPRSTVTSHVRSTPSGASSSIV